MLKTPGFTVAAVIVLGFATGANTAIFSLIDTVLLRPLDYPEPDRLVSIYMPTQAQPNGSVDYPDYFAFRDAQQTLSCIALENWQNFDLAGQGKAERIRGAIATASAFQGNGFPFILGRPFTEAEDRQGGPRVVVLTEPLWRTRFNADPNILGKNITLNGVGLQVVGVVPVEPEFRSPPLLYLPLNLADDVLGWRKWRGRDSHSLACWGRLKRGVTIAQAQADLEVIERNLVAQFPEDKGYGVRVDDSLYSEVRDYVPMLWLLQAAGGFLLLISTTNVATLLFARSLYRQREMSIRAAIGASRLRLIGSLLLESSVLALIGGVVGVPIALLGIQLIRWVSPEDMGRIFTISFDGAALLFSFGVAAFTAISSGLVPSLFLSKTDLATTLCADGNRGATSGLHQKRIQSAMITCQVAIASVLLIGAGLLVRSFQAAQNAPLGFVPDHLLTAEIYLANHKYHTGPQADAFFTRLLENIRRIHGVASASMSSNPPFSWEEGYFIPFAVVGKRDPEPGQEPVVDVQEISSDYFQTIKTPIFEGRDFNEGDQRSAPGVVIINRAFADTFFAGQNPLGKQIRMVRYFDMPEKPYTIVGVAENARHSGPDHHPVKFEAYFPFSQHNVYYEVLVIHSVGDDLSLSLAVQKAVESIDPDVPLANVMSFNDMISRNFATRRLTSLVVSIFSGAALTLSAVGLYGVLAYSVSQQTRAIGVRIAVGASPHNVLAFVFTQGFRIVGAGVLAGVLGAILLANFFSSLLYGVGGNDPLTIATSIIVLCLTAFLACLPPALRATRINPVTALRE